MSKRQQTDRKPRPDQEHPPRSWKAANNENAQRDLSHGGSLDRSRGHPAKDWKGALQQLINSNNSRHSKRSKVVAHETQDKRAKGLFLAFRTLRDAGFDIGPAQLKGRHVEFLMWYWTADPRAADLLEKSGAHLAPRKHPYKPATIQTYLSFLRTLAT